MNINNITSSVGNTVQKTPVKDIEKVSTDTVTQDSVVDKQLIEREKVELYQNDETTEPAQEQGIKKALAEVNDFFQHEQRKLQFSVNDVTGDVIVEVKDSETNEILRQIPPEFVVKLAEHLNEQAEDLGAVGVLLKEQA